LQCRVAVKFIIDKQSSHMGTWSCLIVAQVRTIASHIVEFCVGLDQSTSLNSFVEVLFDSHEVGFIHLSRPIRMVFSLECYSCVPRILFLLPLADLCDANILGVLPCVLCIDANYLSSYTLQSLIKLKEKVRQSHGISFLGTGIVLSLMLSLKFYLA
jgi:hypothetical protein